MLKTETIRARIEPDLKHKVDKIFEQLELTTSQAIILFYRQIILNHGLPFELKLPNKLTQEAMSDVTLDKDLILTTLSDVKDKFS